MFKEKEKLYENSGEEELLVLLKELKEVPCNQNMVSHSEELVSRNEEELIQDSLNNDSLTILEILDLIPGSIESYKINGQVT